MGVFDKFKYERLPLSLIKLDTHNPRIVTPTRLTSEDEIVRYMFEHEDLEDFLKKIVSEGRNQGAERPYVVKNGKEYTVLEGNSRIASYKLLTGLISPPAEFATKVLPIETAVKEALLTVECSIAPTRDALLPIMAASHFGRGDKVQWGFLGSRKAVYDEHKGGKSISQLASVFGIKQHEVRELILQYEFYLAVVQFNWTPAEKDALMNPNVAFNPPIRFMETTGHREKVGVVFDRTNLTVTFDDEEARRKAKHMVRKLVITPEKGLGATASYEAVFVDYVPPKPAAKASGAAGQGASMTGAAPGNTGPASASSGSGQAGAGAGVGQAGSSGSSGASGSAPAATPGGAKLKKNALFDYPVKIQNRLLIQFMKEAKKINIVDLPAAGTSLLRGIVEAVCKNIIDKQGANTAGKQHDLESAINLCLSNAVTLNAADKSILKQFKAHHLANLNLATHATVVPNHHLLMAARDTIDQFVMRNI